MKSTPVFLAFAGQAIGSVIGSPQLHLAGGKAQAAYPTTFTSVHSTTQTFGVTQTPPFSGFPAALLTVTRTVTTLDAWESAPTSYPFTFTRTEISTVTETSILFAAPETTAKTASKTYEGSTTTRVTLDGPDSTVTPPSG